MHLFTGIIVFRMHLVHIVLVSTCIACDSQRVYFHEFNFDIPLSLFRTIINGSEKGPLPTV